MSIVDLPSLKPHCTFEIDSVSQCLEMLRMTLPKSFLMRPRREMA